MPPGEGRAQRGLDDLALVLVLAALATLFAWAGWAWRLDRLVYDASLALWSRPAPADVLIVAIDDASIAAIGRWPWRRAVHATLLDRLSAARPKAIALDLVLSEPDPDPRQDALLAGSLATAQARAAPVVLPLSWRTDALAGLAPLEPVEVLRPFVRTGAAEPSPDADGILRHAFLSAGPAGRQLPHLACALLRAGGDRVESPSGADAEPAGRPTDDARPSWQRRGRFPVRYAGPPGTFEHVSYVDVLRGAVPAERIAGRYVLIGATAQGLGDRQATPVDRGGPAMAGIEVLANVLQSLRSGDLLVEWEDARVAALSSLSLGLLVFGMTRAGPTRALPLALASLPLAVGASVAALRVGVWCSPVPFSLAALLAYPLWSWRRLKRVLTGLDREIVHLREAAGSAHAPGDPVGSRLRALRAAADVVRDARRFLAEALEAQPAAMLVAGDDRRVSVANARAAAIFGVTGADELIGLDLARLLQEFSTPGAIDWRDALSSARPAGSVQATEARLGDACDVMLHVAAVELQGHRRWIVTLADVAPIRQAEREREEALAFISHDLRAPAGSIVLLADLNLAGNLRTPRDELLDQVRRLAARTLQLAEAFVRSSHAASQPLQAMPVALGELVGDALHDIGPQAEARGVRFETEHAEATVTVDRFLLARALANLVSNAVRHSPENGVVGVRALIDGGQLRLRVRDRGAGLTAGQIAELAAHDRGATAGSPNGVGLGLLFVQRVAQRHGGTLRLLHSAPDLGTEFEIAFDVADAARGASGIP